MVLHLVVMWYARAIVRHGGTVPRNPRLRARSTAGGPRNSDDAGGSSVPARAARAVADLVPPCGLCRKKSQHKCPGLPEEKIGNSPDVTGHESFLSSVECNIAQSYRKETEGRTSSMKTESRLNAVIDSDADRSIGIFRDLHQNPELGFMEVRTTGIVAKQVCL